MKSKRVIRLLVGVTLLAIYELPDSSGVGTWKRWNKLKGRAGK